MGIFFGCFGIRELLSCSFCGESLFSLPYSATFWVLTACFVVKDLSLAILLARFIEKLVGVPASYASFASSMLFISGWSFFFETSTLTMGLLVPKYATVFLAPADLDWKFGYSSASWLAIFLNFCGPG